MKRLLTMVIFLTTIIALSGCGGGGGGSETNGDPGTNSVNYHLRGVGVIQQSLSSVESTILTARRKSSMLKSLPKTIDLPKIQGAKGPDGVLRAVSQEFLLNNAAFVYLTWDTVSGATRYQITYNDVVVWDSAGTHVDDPAYDESTPCAYLDLDNELAGRINRAGQYSFQVTAYNAASIKARMTAVTVSLGMTLENYPTVIAYNSGTHQLSWTGVANAGGYRVRVYDESWNEITSAGSGTTLLNTTGYDLSSAGLTAGTYYLVRVDAQALNRSGNPVEITQGISGFTY